MPKIPPRLESLPAELIVQIFNCCLEVNLVHAHPNLSQALSQEATYKTLILFAFFDDDEEHPVEKKHFLPAPYRRLEVDEKVRLQRDILKCRWCTLQRVNTCLPTLTRLRIAQEWYAERENEKPHLLGDDQDHILTDRQNVAELPDLDALDALKTHFFADLNEFDVGENKASGNPSFPRIIRWSFTLAGSGKIRKSLGTSASVLGARHIPDKLLRGGPWTDEKIQYLQLLRQGHRFIQSGFVLDVSIDGIFKGMANAIRENNQVALVTLLELHYAAFRRDRFTIVNLRPAKQLFAVPFSFSLPPKLFHIAVKESPDPSGMLATLLREGIDSIPDDDPVLTSWALRASDHEDNVAAWLLKHMERTEYYGLGGRDSPLFINGELNPRRADGEYPFADRSFTAELGYITHGAVAFIPQPLDETPE